MSTAVVVLAVLSDPLTAVLLPIGLYRNEIKPVLARW